MADCLVLRLGDKSNACSWVVVDADGRRVEPQREGSLAEARAAALGRRLIVLVPGKEVITTNAELPLVSKARLRQMLPFALEDDIADDVSTLHFAAGIRNERGLVLVSAVARASLEQWLRELAEAGLQPAAIYADTDGVADTPSTLNVVVENETIYARRPGEAAFSIEGLSLAEALEIMLDGSEDQDPPQHALLCMDEAARRACEHDIERISARLASLDVKVLPDGALQLFAAKLVNHPGANLLQGAYAPRSDWGALMRPWRIAAALAGGLIATMALGSIVDYIRLSRTDTALTSAIEARCAEELAAPGFRQCEAVVQARLRSLGETTAGDEEFLSTMVRVAETAGDEDQLRTLSYRNRVMDVQILTPDVPALDEFSRRLNESGDLTVTVQSTNPQQGGGVEARVQIAGGAQ